MSEINVRLLELAKELLIMEYNDRKAQDHNRWLLESEKAWRVSRTRLEHPPFPPFPTHDDIVQRAKSLQGFVQAHQESTVTSDIPKQESICITETTATIVESESTPDCTTETTATTTASSASSIEADALNKTIANDVENKFDHNAVPGMKQFDLPDNLLAYSRIKVANNLEDRVPGSARVITNLLNTLKGDNKKEK